MIEPLLILSVYFLLVIFIPKDNEKSFNIFDKNFTIGLRGLAISLIVFTHVACCFGSRYFTPMGGPGSAIFILVSGYGINESFKRYAFTGYWKKKMIKVYLPYLIAISLLFLFKQISTDYYIFSLTTIESPYWFVSFVFKNYLIFYLTSKYAYKYRFILMFIFSLIILLFSNEQEASQAFSFILGVWLSENISKIRSIHKKHLIAIGIIAFTFATIFLILKQLPIVRQYAGSYIYNVVQCCIKLPYAISIIAIVIFIPKLIKSKFVIFLSIIAYELYLVHMPFYPYIKGNILYASYVLIGSVFFAWIFNKFNGYISNRLIK